MNTHGVYRSRLSLLAVFAGALLLFAFALPPLAKGLVTLDGPHGAPNPNQTSLQAACPAGSLSALLSGTGASTNSDNGHSIKTQNGFTFEWSTSVVDGDSDGQVDDFVFNIYAIHNGDGEPIAYSKVFVFVGGGSTYVGTLPQAQESSAGDDALVVLDQGKGKITQFGFCVYPTSGALRIDKAVPQPVNETDTFTVHYECVLGDGIVADGDVTFGSHGGSVLVDDIPMSAAQPPVTSCTLTEPGVDMDLYTPVLPAAVTLLTDTAVVATVTNNPATTTTTSVVPDTTTTTVGPDDTTTTTAVPDTTTTTAVPDTTTTTAVPDTTSTTAVPNTTTTTRPDDTTT
ncbi:MAG: hypothetical protein KDB86_06620, partial [Actinobacteria bacterium]|nr:hypothetical protein [Actinomycetota bacterium]